MKIVIEITKDMLDWVNSPDKFNSEYGIYDFIELIRNGTPLPEHYGDLIDREAIKKRAMFVSGDNLAIEGVEVVTVGMIDNALAIIPATKGDSKNETCD